MQAVVLVMAISKQVIVVANQVIKANKQGRGVTFFVIVITKQVITAASTVIAFAVYATAAVVFQLTIVNLRRRIADLLGCFILLAMTITFSVGRIA